MMDLKHKPEYYHTTFFKWRQRVGFGISDYACNLAYLLTNTYLLFYYTNCAGIDPGPVGIMFVVTKFVDAITDVLVGSWIDHTDTKMGRYRPWMLFGAPVLAVGMILLFSVPVGWNSTPKLIWAYLTYIIFSFGYTLVNVPMVPIVSALSPEPVERTSIVTTKQLFASLGSLTSSLFVLPMVNFFAGGENAAGSELATGYRMTNVVLGVIVIILMIICVFNIEETNPPTVIKESQKSNFIKDVRSMFNRYYIMLIAYVFFFFLGYLGMMASIQYYFTYIIGSTSAMALAMSLMTLIPIPTMVLAAILNSKGIGKSRLIIFGGIIDLIALFLLLFSKSAPFAVGAMALYAFGSGFRVSLMFAMCPDIYDYTEYSTGKSLAGTQSAVVGFGSKLSSALASAIVSALLVWGSYNAAELDAVLSGGGTVQDIAAQYPTAITAIKLAFVGLSIVTSVITVLILLPYDLDKKYPAIRAELNKRAAK